MATIAGDWSEPQGAVLAPDSAWLRAPLAPVFDTAVLIESVSDEEQEQPGGVFHPLGATDAVVVTDARRAGTFSVRFTCRTAAARQRLRDILDAGTTLLLQGRAERSTNGLDGGDHLYVRPVGTVQLARPMPGRSARYVVAEFAVVGRP